MKKSSVLLVVDHDMHIFDPESVLEENKLPCSEVSVHHAHHALLIDERSESALHVKLEDLLAEITLALQVRVVSLRPQEFCFLLFMLLR